MPPDELAGAISARAAPGLDRAAPEEALDILRERLRRWVALVRLLPHRLHHDGVDVSLHLARLGDRARLLGVLFADQPQQLRRLRILDVIRTATGHELVEHDAEGIDVARGRHRAGRGPAPGWHSRASASGRGSTSPGRAGRPRSGRASSRCRSRGASASPSEVTRMLPGFRSRWTTRFWCAYWTAAQTSWNRRRRSRIGRRPRFAIPQERLPLDVLHDEVRLPGLGCAAVEEPRDVRMVEGRPRSDARSGSGRARRRPRGLRRRA